MAREVARHTRGTYTEEFLRRLNDQLKEWQDKADNRLTENGELKPEYWTRPAGKGKVKDEFRSGSGEFPVKEVYTPLDIANTDPITEIGLPGIYPYTRGRDPLGPQAITWPLKFYSGYGSEGGKERYQTLYNAGSRFFVLAFDLPTQLGYDSDSPWAKGEVGRVGVALDTIDDIDRLLGWAPLDKVRTGTVGNCIGPWAFAMFYLLGKKAGINPDKMKVNLQNDPFKEYTGRGTYIFPPKIALDLASDTTAYICQHVHGEWEPQYYCTSPIRWGGCNVSQEVGWSIANLMTYIDEALKKGVQIEELVPRTNLHMTTDNDLFEEVAKFRAVRRLWAKIARERYGTDDPRVLSIRITVYTASNRLTAQQPLNNIIRTTMHALASMLGGVETMSIPAYDEAHALPTAESTRLASLIPHVLTDENMVGNTADPLAGSYYVEWLTDKIEEGGRRCYDEVQAMGGGLAAIESGYYLRETTEGMYKYQQEIRQGVRHIIGVNKYAIDQEEPIELFKNNPKEEIEQVERLKKIRGERDNKLVEKCLAEVRKVAENKVAGKNENIVPSILASVEACATVGEIFGILREVFGEYKLPMII